MGLRLRVILILLAVVIPVTLAFTFYRFGTELRQITQRRVERFSRRLPPRMMRRCEKRPPRFVAKKKNIQVWAYSTNFESRNPKAPAFPKDLRSVDEEALSKMSWFKGAIIGQSAKKYKEDGDCAIFLFRWKGHQKISGIYPSVIFESLLMMLILTLLGFAISAPLVFRIRRLKRALVDLENEEFDISVYKKNDELDDLARAFGKVLERLKRRDKDLQDYVANTTHDLATPITVLQHRLRRLDAFELQEDARIVVQKTLEESFYIAALISNMGAAARLDNALVLGEVNLDVLVKRIVGRHLPIAEAKELSLDFALPDEVCWVKCDETLTEQAISNVVQNAIQYNFSGGHIAMVLEVEEMTFSLRILDDGPGVNPDLLERLSERSIRSDSARNRNPGGQGFGLSITSSIAQAHGWILTFQNLEKGFEVRFSGKRVKRHDE